MRLEEDQIKGTCSPLSCQGNDARAGACEIDNSSMLFDNMNNV